MTDRPEQSFCVPGLAAIVAPDEGPMTSVFLGVDGAGNAIREDTLFPIASASKLALGLAVLQLVDRDVIALDDQLKKYLPAAAAADPAVTLRSLLSHTSGLPLEYDLSLTPYNGSIGWDQISQACLATCLASPPNSCVQYSNVGFALLALVIERVTGKDFKLVLEDSVFRPLGVEAYIGRSPPRRPAVVVDMNSDYVGTGLEPYNSEFWFHLGTPWAGIYTTAAGLLALLLAYTKLEGGIISGATALEARRDQTRGLSGGFASTDPFLGFRSSNAIRWEPCAWGLGLELKGTKRPHWSPPSAAPDSFGQIGASGCLAWYDPAHRVGWVALAPRTTDNGWLLRHGSNLGKIALSAGNQGSASSSDPG
uniref:serine hydrolase domain-containing protein n=1 Tax=uncultured Sphingomonas sp. TaxID=158754 RepID=UPI0025D47E74|nr:serine hydrolase domain-containing protein [uncultured Sphingomonas sp.]